MDEKTRLFLWLIRMTIVLSSTTASQIYFPQDSYPTAQSTATAPVYVAQPEELLTDLTTIERSRPVSNIPQNEDQAKLARGNRALTLNINRIVPALYPHIAQADYLVLGPVTITGALALVLLASVGRTFDEIANALGFNALKNVQHNFGYLQEQLGELYSKFDSSKSSLEANQLLDYAAGIFVQKDYPLRPAFEQVASTIYKSQVKNVDYQRNSQAAQKTINDFISERTHNKISELLSDPPLPHTKSIIVSVFYFKAAWEFPFFAGHTKLRPFFVNGRKKSSNRMVEMMSNGGEFPHYKDNKLGVQILGFPYKGKQTTMYVILPNDSNREKLRQLESSLTADDIERLVSSTKHTEAVILFPKMKLESTLDLRPALKGLGVNALFDPSQANLALLSPGINNQYNFEDAPFVSPPVNAPSGSLQPPLPPQFQEEEGGREEEERLIFTRFGNNRVNASQYQQNAGINSYPALGVLDSLRHQQNLQNPGLYADQVIHKVYIDITESGTEAASATGVSLNRSGGRVTFRVDMPFMFFIYHEETKTIMFWGSVKSPPSGIL